ncbi:MAG TPA: valine--tRNA ligase [Acetobacteraceae bacterium]|nr:valine--tRNA ligase [Acetobacteraceae bacterium]
MTLDKTYRPDEVEPRQYAAWERSGGFTCDPTSAKRPYTIMMPPPNVTGSLHMGHALTFTLQDILIRFERMRGRDALWQPGTDHAGIATEIVVTNQLAERQINKHDLGRDKFIERVWEWKAESGGTIVNQLRRLGCSPDWKRERFTMDPGLAAAVRKVFVQLYREGLIYRDKRLVNWDPEMHTTISDLEVDSRETKGKLWHIRYPIEGEDGRYVVVATTRPETMLGDTGVAVHPEDARFADVVGKNVRLPLVGRLIPIVADEYADPEMGSGAVKITPAHDFNDFAVGQRHGLEMINIFDEDAHLNDNAPEAYRGLDRFVARKQVLADLEAADLIEKIDDHTLMVPHHDRSGVIIEPWLTDQWYCNAKVLAEPAIAAVETGQTVFVPRQWENTFFAWMRDIQPWCISRQLWWGHRIPAWYGPDGSVFVARDAAEAQALADAQYGRRGETLEQDEDVLDTWFSSGLWPFSTLGWPEKTPELARYYPSDVLVTGFDIIFFWVARMMMQGIHFMGDVPFRTVYIHGLVRDERGQKMSKSKGNIIDPLELIDQFGADALRFTICALTGPGRDVKLGASRVQDYRSFVTKLWNASRFCEMNGIRPDASFTPSKASLPLTRWILDATNRTVEEATAALDAYRFDEYAAAGYRFTWNTFCDWFLELAKPVLEGELDGAAEVRATAAHVLGVLLRLLHPAIPFVTEELWDHFGYGAPCSLIRAAWPEASLVPASTAAREELDWVVRLVSAVRSVRTAMNVPPSATVPILLRDAKPETLARAQRWIEPIRRLARGSEVSALAGDMPKGAAQAVVDEATAILPLAGTIDLDAEHARLTRERDKAVAEAAKLAKKLQNADFVSRAPDEVVAENRERLAAFQADVARLEAALRWIE